MARQPASSKTIQSWISEYPDLSFDGVDVVCKLCDIRISCTRKTGVIKHVASKKHQALIGGDLQKRFSVDLLTFMVGCNISWRQLDNPMFREFIENCLNGQYGESQLPGSTTMRRHHLPQVADSVISNIRSELHEKYIWISINEVANACGYRVVNVLVGALEEICATRAYLLSSKVLEGANLGAIATSVSTVVDDSLKLLWGERYEGNKDRFLLFITDGVGYMKAAGRILQQRYNFLHVTCLVHAYNQMIETIKELYPKVDTLISSVQKVFRKSPVENARFFCEILPHVELPPEPLATQCSSWIEAATYYFIHLEDVKQVLLQLDYNESAEVADAQEAVMDATIHGSLREIHNCFSRIPLVIQQLEQRSKMNDFSLIEDLNAVYDLRCYISMLMVESAQCIQQKLENVLESNPGFQTLTCIAKLLQKEEVDFSIPGIHESSLHKYSSFRFAPVTSINLEQSLTLHKWIFSDKRRRLSPSHLEQILVISFYNQTIERSR